MDPLSERYTFFEKLPEKLSSKSHIAKVLILEANIDTANHRVSKARVVDVIKGFKNQQIITIHSDISSCSRDPDVLVGQTFFIAGKLEADGVFRGDWLARNI